MLFRSKRGVGIGAEEDEERSWDWGRGESSRHLASCDIVIPERYLTRREEGEERVLGGERGKKWAALNTSQAEEGTTPKHLCGFEMFN